jgi:hypothetical protein
MNNNPTDSKNPSHDTEGAPDSVGRAFNEDSDALATPAKKISPISIDESVAFDILENPQNWPSDPAIQATMAELLEVHLALHAHADELASTLMRPKGFRRHASGWLIAAAAAFAVLPATYVFTRVREAHRMQTRGAELVTQYQKRVQAKLWSDFFMDSLDLLKQVQSRAKYCAPDLEDRGGEIETALMTPNCLKQAGTFRTGSQKFPPTIPASLSSAAMNCWHWPKQWSSNTKPTCFNTN